MLSFPWWPRPKLKLVVDTSPEAKAAIRSSAQRSHVSLTTMLQSLRQDRG